MVEWYDSGNRSCRELCLYLHLLLKMVGLDLVKIEKFVSCVGPVQILVKAEKSPEEGHYLSFGGLVKVGKSVENTVCFLDLVKLGNW